MATGRVEWAPGGCQRRHLNWAKVQEHGEAEPATVRSDKGNKRQTLPKKVHLVSGLSGNGSEIGGRDNISVER